MRFTYVNLDNMLIRIKLFLSMAIKSFLFKRTEQVK